MSKRAYYAARAIDERLQAQAAVDARAAAAHLEMSARYEALASEPILELPADRRPAPRAADALHCSEPTIVLNPTD